MNNTFINQGESIYSKNSLTSRHLIKKYNKLNDNKSIISTAESTKSYISSLEEEIEFNEEILYCKKSLFIFSNNNKFRILCQNIFSNNVFIIIVNIIIFLNTITLILETNKKYRNIYRKFNYFFAFFYITESIIKIIALGFVLSSNTYLRDPWNCLDFFVAVSANVNLILKNGGTAFNVLRMFRLLRPFKTIKVFPNMRRFFNILINSFFDLMSIYILMLFIIFIFSILGLNLFYDRFNYFCRKSLVPINGKLEKNDLFNTSFCGGHNDCNGFTDYCLSNSKFYNEKTYFLFGDINKYNSEINYEEFNYGITTFKNFYQTLLTVFIISTGKGWSKIMFFMINGCNYTISILYFFLCIIVNYYFVSNLSVAVLLYNFENSRTFNIKNYLYNNKINNAKFFNKYLKKIKTKENIKKQKKKYNEIISLKKGIKIKEQLKKLFKNYNKFQLIKKITSKNEFQKKYKFSYYCYLIYEQPIYKIFFIFYLLFNAIILSIENNLDEKKNKIFQIFNIIGVIIIFINELLIFLSNSPKKYFFNLINIFYCIIIISSITELVIKTILNSKKKYSVISILYLLKIFKLFKIYKKFSIIIQALFYTCYRMLDFLFLFLIILYIYSLLGFSLFNQSLKFYKNKYNPNSSSTNFNFDSFMHSLFSTFIIIIGYGWEKIFYDCLRSSRTNNILTIIYFVSLVLIGQITLMNIFLAYLIENYEESVKIIKKNNDVHKNNINYKLQITKIFQINELYYNNKNNKYKNIKKNQNILNILTDNLYHLDLLRYTKLGYFTLIGKSEINFIINKAKIIDNYHILNKNRKLKYKKVVLYKKIMDERKNLQKINKKEIDYMEFYNFVIDYKKKYEDFYPVKKTKTESDTIFLNNNEKIKNLLEKSYSEESGEDDTVIQLNEIKPNKIKKKVNMKQFNNKRTADYTLMHYYNKKNNYLKSKNKINSRRNSVIKFLYNNNLFQNDNNNLKNLNNNNLSNFKKQNTIFDQSKLHMIFSVDDKIEEKKDNEVIENYIPNNKKIWEKIKDYLKDSNLFIFHKDWKFTKFIHKIVNLKEFEYFIFTLILLNVIIISLDSNNLRDGSNQKNLINILNIIFNSIFFLECILKIIGNGLIFYSSSKKKISLKASDTFEIIIKKINENNEYKRNFDQLSEKERNLLLNKIIKQINVKKAYLTDSSNYIDFLCVIISIIDMSVSNHYNYIRSIKVFKSIRPLRLISRNNHFNILIKSLIKSLPQIIFILFITFIFLFVISIFSMNLFSNIDNYYCTLDINYNYELCIHKGGNWIYYKNSFTNFLNSMKINFEIMIGENWENYMYYYTKKDNNIFGEFFFILEIIILNMLLLKLIISILIQTFKESKNKINTMKNLTVYEKDWIKLQNLLMKYKPVKEFKDLNDSYFRMKIKKFVNTKFFEYSINLCIILSILFLSVQYDGISSNLKQFLNLINYILTLIFNIEIILKLIVSGTFFFKLNRNIFDFIIVIFCDLLVIINILNLNFYNTHSVTTIPILLRAFRIVKVLRLLSGLGKLSQLIDTLLNIIPRVYSIILLISIFLIIYANIGMNIFGTIVHRKYINSENNFEDFFSSIVVLFTIMTGDNWNKIMNELAYHDCRNSSSEIYSKDPYCYEYNVTCYDNYMINYTNLDNIYQNKNLSNYYIKNDKNENSYHYTCGTDFSYFYFISFQIFFPVILLNLCIVLIVEAFSDLMNECDCELNENIINKFLQLWIENDQNCNLIIYPQDFILILKEMPPPFGFNYDRLIYYNPLKYKKFYNQFSLFKSFLEKDNKNNYISDINFNDENFRLNFNNDDFPYLYNFTNFYISKNKKFYTYDLEVIKFLEKFNVSKYTEKTERLIDKDSFTFQNDIAKNLKQISYRKGDQNYFVHYVDACIIMAGIAICKLQNIDYKNLRFKVANYYTMDNWIDIYYSNEIIKLFLQKESNDNKINKIFINQVNQRINKIFSFKMNKIKEIQKNKNKNNNNISDIDTNNNLLRSSIKRNSIIMGKINNRRKTINDMSLVKKIKLMLKLVK